MAGCRSATKHSQRPQHIRNLTFQAKIWIRITNVRLGYFRVCREGPLPIFVGDRSGSKAPSESFRERTLKSEAPTTSWANRQRLLWPMSGLPLFGLSGRWEPVVVEFQDCRFERLLS